MQPDLPARRRRRVATRAEQTFDGVLVSAVLAAPVALAMAGLGWRLFRWAAGWGW